MATLEKLKIHIGKAKTEFAEATKKAEDEGSPGISKTKLSRSF